MSELVSGLEERIKALGLLTTVTPSLFSLLFEETISSAAVSGLALYDFYDESGSLWFVLYEVDRLDQVTPLIKAEIEIEQSSRCNGFWEVKRSAAKSGYGPLVYEIALSSDEVTKKNNGLIPDSGSVSRDAQAVWNKFYQRGDVEVVDLTNKCYRNYNTDRFAGLSQGNFKISGIKLKEPLDISGLIQQHENNLQRVGKRIEELIQDQVINYFNKATGSDDSEWESDINDDDVYY